MEILELAREHYPDIPAFFVVNKTDLPTSWHWSEEELNSYAQKFASLTKTSAKTGENEKFIQYNCVLVGDCHGYSFIKCIRHY